MESQSSIIDNMVSAWGLGRMMYTQMALRAAIELKVFDIIASSGPNAQLSCAQILSKIPTKNPDASCYTLERILRMLGVSSILTMSSRKNKNDNNKTEIAYGLTRETHCLATNANGFSASSIVIFHSEKENVECLYMLKDAVLNPENNFPLYKAYHGQTFFDDLSKKPKLSHSFNQFLGFSATGVIEALLDTYKGFEGVTEVMDVGGNIGGAIQMIVSRYPNIRGINFDLPHVIANAPTFPDVEHIAGDMFQSLPKAQTIFMKPVLHDWDDEHCIKILSNCWKALPENNGKVIAAEFILPQVLDTNTESAVVVSMDFAMLVHMGGKERSLAEFKTLAKNAGFNETKLFPFGKGFYAIEFIKCDAM